MSSRRKRYRCLDTVFDILSSIFLFLTSTFWLVWPTLDREKQILIVSCRWNAKRKKNRKTISNWETGKTTPDIDSLIRLANFFYLSLDNLLLEGSEVVENIKNDAELRRLKGIRSASLIMSLCSIIIIIFTQSFIIEMLVFVMMFCNLVMITDLDNKIKRLKK